MRRFEAAGTLDFIAAKNFGIGHDNDFGRLEKKPARQSAEADVKRTGVAEAVFPPDFLEALAFAVVVAEDINKIALTGPAVELAEELLALGFGDVRLGRTVADGAENIEALEMQNWEWRIEE